MLEDIGTERTCEKCGELPAWEYRPDKFRCRRHLQRALLGHFATLAGVTFGELRLGSTDTITPIEARNANLLRVLPLSDGRMELSASLTDSALDFMKNATFDANGDLTGFGQSEPTIRLVQPDDDESPTEAEETYRTMFKTVGRMMWESSNNRIRRALGLTEQHFALLTHYQDIVDLPADDKQFMTAARLISSPAQADWWVGKPEELLDVRERIQRKYAIEVGIPAGTVESASRERLAELCTKHEDSRFDLTAAALYWAVTTDPKQRSRRRAEWELRCVSSRMVRVGRQFFDEWDDEGPKF